MGSGSWSPDPEDLSDEPLPPASLARRLILVAAAAGLLMWSPWTSTLHVTSTPEGAVVVVDGAERGRTPLLIEDLDEGAHDVQLSLAHHQPSSTRVITEPWTRVPAHSDLVPWGELDLSALDPDVVARADDEIIVDDGLRVPAGRMNLVLERSGHASQPVELDVQVGPRASRVVAAPWVRLVGQISLSKLGPDVVARIGGEVVTDGSSHPPGQVDVLLEKPNHAVQTVTVDIAVGESVDVEAEPWVLFMAGIDLRGLGSDVIARVDGTVASGTMEFAEARMVEIQLSRSGCRDHTGQYPLKLGKVLDAGVIVELNPWVPLNGSLDLSGLVQGATVRLRGEVVADGHDLPPGRHQLEISREDHRDVAVPVTVFAGKPASVRVSAKDWVPTRLSFEAALTLLRDLARWDRATLQQRRLAAEAVDRGMAAFALSKLESFSAGGQRHEVAIFDHARTGLEFVLVPVGTFRMGSPGSEKDRGGDERQHRVTLTKPFLIARTECTQAAWERAGGENHSKWKGPRLPIEQVSWQLVTAWCGNAGLRLPSEAEWEFACRAGTTTPFNVGEDITTAQANHDGSYPYRGRKGADRERTLDVGRLSQNSFGLSDMHGNVLEWCQDVYDSTYTSGSATDPICTSGSEYRVLRGGSWVHGARLLRSAYRDRAIPGSRNRYFGFRPAQSVNAD